MADITKGAVGPELSYDVSFSGGKLVVALNYAGAQASGGLNLSISAAQLIAAAAEKISNPTEKALLIGLETIIAAIP